MKRRPVHTLYSAALALLLSLGALPTLAATYVVSNLNDSGEGSLRAAIAQADSTPDDDRITFTVNGTIQLLSPLMWNNRFVGGNPFDGGSLAIDATGQQVTITNKSGSQVLRAMSPASANRTLRLKALTIADRRSDTTVVVDSFYGHLQLVECVFSGNHGVFAVVLKQGGDLLMDKTVFSGNSVSNGAIIRALGGIGSVTITNSSLTNNATTELDGQSFGVLASNVITTITNSSFESNTGIFSAVVMGIQDTSKLTVVGSTFNGNRATKFGGGAILTNATTTIINSTFHANEAVDTGGAIQAISTNDRRRHVTVTNSTFSGNKSTLSGGSSVHFYSSITGTLRNTIIANSTGSNCGGSPIDGGGNLSDDLSCNFTAASSLNGTAAQLGSLADNGGPTKTMMPLTGSPAIDQGVNTLALDAAGAALTTDQRGFARISLSGGTVDRGAVEVPAVPPPVLTTCPAATAQVGVAYSSALGVTGGTAPNRFSFTGSLPRGLALGAATGALTGMPIKPGSYAFTATVADSASPTPRSSSKACVITVAEAANRGPLIVTPTRLHYAPVPLPAVLMKQTVTLTNIGNPGLPPVKGGGTPVQLGPISVTPDPGTADGAFTLLNPCPAVLYVGQSCTIVVVGPARPASPLSATLNIPNNAPASPQTVALSASAAP